MRAGVYVVHLPVDICHKAGVFYTRLSGPLLICLIYLRSILREQLPDMF